MKEAVAYPSFPLPMPEAGKGLPPGTVQVSVWVPAALDKIWAAITRGDDVRRWFGDLSGDLTPHGRFRLDFGDADFFELSDVRLEPPDRLYYQWRFLGTGPSNAIAWQLVAKDGGVQVTVTDAEPSRSASTVQELTEGWTDFLRRLQVHGATGQTTRYTWRKQFDGSVELPVPPETAAELLRDAERAWLPWRGGLAMDAIATVADGRTPDRFTVHDVARSGPLQVNFALGCPQWNAPTSCEIALQKRPHGSLLVISHGGWEEIGGDDAERGAQRQRFGELWVQAMRDARRHVSERC